MSFNIGLSGLRAANNDLNVTGNNIANAGTVGFKQSRAEFADVYAASVLGNGSNPRGSGVLMADVAQLFNQGNINYTQNTLDLAINGNGFFQVSNNGAISYTRAGYFGTDREGNIVDNFGYNLQGYTIDANGNLQNGVIGNLRVQTVNQEPRATSTMTQAFNLNSTNQIPVTTPFNPADPASYNSSTSTQIYDTQGNAHVLTQYFVKTGPNAWDMHVLVDGRNPANPDTIVNPGPPPTYDDAAGTTPFTVSLTFDEAGHLVSSASADVTVNADGTLLLNNWTPAAPSNGTPPVWGPNGAQQSPEFLTIDLRKSTQFASPFAVNSVSQNGYTTGELAGLEIDDTGMIFARYTNGQTKVQGQIILADFANVQGLSPVGKTQWVQTYDSGEPVRNPPRSGTLGAIQSGALEDSNVELSDQLVNLIVAQRNYQANAKTIETESAITQTIINLR